REDGVHSTTGRKLVPAELPRLHVRVETTQRDPLVPPDSLQELMLHVVLVENLDRSRGDVAIPHLAELNLDDVERLAGEEGSHDAIQLARVVFVVEVRRPDERAGLVEPAPVGARRVRNGVNGRAEVCEWLGRLPLRRRGQGQ